MKKIASLLFVTTLSFAVPANAQLASTTEATTTGSIATPVQRVGMVANLQAAKMLLNNVQLNHEIVPVYKKVTSGKKKGTLTLTGYQIGTKGVAVAVYNPANGGIFVVHGTQRGKEMQFNEPGFDVKLRTFNGVNSRFTVSNPAGGYVIAIRYLITPVESGSKASIENVIEHATYVPYTPELNVPEVVAAGDAYITGVVSAAAAQLGLYPSVAEPGKMVPEAVKPALIKALVLAEHTDGGSLAAADTSEDVAAVIGRTEVLFAGNGPNTYRYSVSTAGARGISQFMPSTYAGHVKRHPNANLEPNFVLGMSDHVNSIKATYLLIDDYIQGVRARAPEGFAIGSAFDYGAAAYNGGVVRVAKAVSAFGQNWNQDRGSQLSSLKAQVAGTTAQIKSLRAQYFKAKDAKTKAKLQAEVDESRRQLAAANEQLAKIENATLRAETQGYLQKIYKVITVINAREWTAQVAGASITAAN